MRRLERSFRFRRVMKRAPCRRRAHARQSKDTESPALAPGNLRRQPLRIEGAWLGECELTHPGGGDERVRLMIIGFELQARWRASKTFERSIEIGSASKLDAAK